MTERDKDLGPLSDTRVDGAGGGLTRCPEDTTPEPSNDIDRKFIIHAVSRRSGESYSHADGVFFKAADPAFRLIVELYPEACRRVGSGEAQVAAATLLSERIVRYQLEHGIKVPDIDDSETGRLLAPNR